VTAAADSGRVLPGRFQLHRDDVAQEHPDFVRLRAVIAKTLMQVSPGQFPSLPATARVASLVAEQVIYAFADDEGQS
jgi:hypothetical protein